MTSRSNRCGLEVRTSSVVQAIHDPFRFSSIGMSDMPMLKSGRLRDFGWSKFEMCAPTDLEIDERMEMA